METERGGLADTTRSSSSSSSEDDTQAKMQEAAGALPSTEGTSAPPGAEAMAAPVPMATDGGASEAAAAAAGDGSGKRPREEEEGDGYEEEDAMDDNMLLAESHVSEQQVQSQELFELVAKWRGEEIPVGPLPGSCTVLTIKVLLEAKTRVKPEKQKLIGLNLKGRPAPDETRLEDLPMAKRPFKFILMGTPEEEVFIDPSARDDLPEVFDDFELDYTALSEEWRRSVKNSENLKKFTAKTEVHLINPPRPGKRLLVLDLDHTLLDFSSRDEVLNRLPVHEVVRVMKRPHLDSFLTACYQHYDLVAWSQTSWRWLELKMVELGLLTHPAYRFCFVLDKTSMFHVESNKPDGSLFRHQVKPLQIIWAKFPQWSEANTVHIDDLSRNFALNVSNGIKIKAYYRNAEGAGEDKELLWLGRYLVHLATKEGDFTDMDHREWRDEAKRRHREAGPGSGSGSGGR